MAQKNLQQALVLAPRNRMLKASLRYCEGHLHRIDGEAEKQRRSPAANQHFTEAVDLTGVVLTKLDGSAKGGIAMAIQATLGIPIKLVGLGEQAEDLIEFDPDAFVDALFAED